MRRRDFTIGLLAAAARSVRAEEQVKQHRIAIVIPAGPLPLPLASRADEMIELVDDEPQTDPITP
jgi:hypothetical protein